MSSKAMEGFKVIGLKFSKDSPHHHELFVNRHSARYETEDKPEDRTLFILNVPPYATKDSFASVFSCVGPVENVIFEARPSSKETSDTNKETNIRGFKVAYVVYENPNSLRKALKLTSLEPLSTSSRPVITGLQKMVQEYNASIYDHAKLQGSIDKLVGKYDKQVEDKKKQEKQEDDEGWTMVTKRGRNPGVSRKESVENKLLEKSDRGAKRKYLSDFYTFQKRETQMVRIVEMRKKHEEDKKKIQVMKQARKFRPY